MNKNIIEKKKTVLFGFCETYEGKELIWISIRWKKLDVNEWSFVVCVDELMRVEESEIYLSHLILFWQHEGDV